MTHPLADYEKNGFAAPLPLLSTGEAASIRDRFYAEIGQSEGSCTRTDADLTSWHQTRRWAWELASDPRLVDVIEAVLGPDLVLWGMCFWYKEPHTSKRIPWHQDGHYYPMHPKRTLTAWVALGPVSSANGGLRILPGRTALQQHVDLRDPDAGFTLGLPPENVDDAATVALTMQPGEMAVFGESTVHGSERNLSGQPRLAFSVRYTTPDVRFFAQRWSHPERIRNYLVRGADRFGHNPTLRSTPPSAK